MVKDLEQTERELPSNEYALGKGLLQPFNATNSGSRKILQIIQKEQSMQLENSETAIIMTGYENQFGENSSSFVTADENYRVLDKIPKYDMGVGISNSNYWVILLDEENGKVHAVQKVSYKHITESYGYNLDTSYLDTLYTGSIIPKGTPIIKPNSFDEANNKCDGVNLTTIYMALALTTEDPIVLSESAAKKFTSPLFSKTQIMLNDNDIILNLYGDDTEYKAFPDIGQSINKGILCGVRRERKDDEALYSQSCDRLKELMISDEKYNRAGVVVDINVYCNDPEKLEESIYNSQVKKYYEKYKSFCNKVVDCIKPLLDSGLTLTYEADKLYYTCKSVIDRKRYIRDKVFNNIIMEIITMESKPLSKGDKITDRYGGKGVVSEILPDWKMPRYKYRNTWLPVDAIYNSSTIVNRENPGQSFETEVTYIGCKIVEDITAWWDYCIENSIDPVMDFEYTENSDFITKSKMNEAYIYSDGTKNSMREYEDMIYRYINILSPHEAEEYKQRIMCGSNDIRYEMMYSIIMCGCIYLAIKPISECMNIDKLRLLYKEFPYDGEYLSISQQSSDGSYRYIATRRKIIPGKKYIYRLKQFAEEKFSAVSLASNNIRGENTKSKANKLGKSPHASTPVRFGDMEVGNLMQMIAEFVIMVLLTSSTSPVARRLHQLLLVGDPFDIDIKLDKDAKSRSVESVNAYLKTMGLRIVCEKIPVKAQNLVIREVVERIPAFKERIEVLAKKPDSISINDFNDIISDIVKSVTANKEPVLVERVPKGMPVEFAEKYGEEELRIDVANKLLEYSNPLATKEELLDVFNNGKQLKECPVKRIVVTRRAGGNNYDESGLCNR
jgi:hypothetical protein